MTVLNGRARADLILNETLTPDREVELRDGIAAGVGDTIITRLNNRNLRTLAGRDWVRNGDIWTVTAVGDDPRATARSVLYGVLQHSGAELSAHETIVTEQEQWGSIAQVAAEYETIAAAQHDRWASLIRNSGLTGEQADSAIGSKAFGPLAAEFRRAEADHHNVDTLLPRLVAARGFGDADDIAAVLHYRVERATARPAGSGRTPRPPRLIAGLIPRAHGVVDAEMRAALDERESLIEARADAVLEAALTESAPWTRALGAPPTDRRRVVTWRKAARVVAAYRDRYRVTDGAPLGAPPESAAQKVDAARARAALDRTLTLSRVERQDQEHSRRTWKQRTGPSL